MNRNRIVLVVVLVVVIVAVAAALLLMGDTGGQQTAQPGDTAGGVSDTNRVNVQQPQNTGPTPTPIEIIYAVAAIQEIPRGAVISEGMLGVFPSPSQLTPFSAFTAESEAGAQELLGDILGQRARTLIPREQIVTSDMVVESLQDIADGGSDAAAVMDPNEVAIALPMDRVTSVAYAIQPGDYVDVIVSLLFVDVDPTFQSMEPNAFNIISVRPAEDGSIELETDNRTIRGAFDTRFLPRGGEIPVIISPSEQQRPRLVTQRTVQRARVVQVGNFPVSGRIFAAPTPTLAATAAPSANAQAEAAPPTEIPRPDIITLAVSPQEAVVLTWMVEARVPITFALRAATNQSLAQTSAVTLDYVMGQYRINLPDKFSYSIQPAIRSIRQLDAGDRIQLEEEETNEAGN